MAGVFQIDPSWRSTGWAFVSSAGVHAAGRVVMSGEDREQDPYRVLSFLEGRARPMLAEYVLAHPGERVRVGIELPPPVIGMKGNKTLTALQLGRLIGQIEGWAAAQTWMDGPHLIAVADWRKFHGIKGPGRETFKRNAMARVRLLGMQYLLDPYPGANAIDGGQQGDVAEAILQGIYAIKHYALGPSRPSVLPAVDGLRGTR